MRMGEGKETRSPPTPTHSRPIPSMHGRAMCKRHGEKSLVFTID
ncbi:hypothetical protein ALC57_15338 [Trachymyrmex cornetzi]|uniref:Uncharacterized protein n=1 Tax=Trachymyrmex cornetzi TaxID=471704 RepID=A0A195DI91_9HYME|nr:hypothetical protein ALC57_15338 [Trachymyrmex cornetzi]